MKHIRNLSGICLLVVFLTEAVAAQNYVATADNYKSSSTNTISQAFSAASTTGHLIIVHLSWDNIARTVSTVTDNKGNHYHVINGPTNWNTTFRSELLYAYDITGGGAPITVTATLSGNSTSFFQIYISEYSDILSTSDPLDKNSVAAGGAPGPTAVSSGAKTTTATNELIYGISIGASGLLSKGAGFTARSTDNQNVVEDKIVTTAGSYSTTFSSAGGDWVAEMVTFKGMTTLPVVLLDFGAEPTTKSTVELDWATATEENSDYFEVQHSRDGVDWTDLTRLKAAGNSNAITHYSTTDATPYTGLTYYRLIEYDLDGRTTYSKVVSAAVDAQPVAAIKIYPVPAVNYLTVEGDNADLQGVGVVNASGQWMNGVVQITKESDSKLNLNLSFLPKGVYFLKTRNKSFSFYKQ